MSRSIIAIAVAAVFAISAPSFAHEDMRVIGTISKQTGSTLEVKTKDGSISKITVDGNTSIMQDKTKADASALKVGANVVIDGSGDHAAELQAITIRIVPTAAK